MTSLNAPPQATPVVGQVPPLAVIPGVLRPWADRVANLVSAVFSPSLLGMVMIAMGTAISQHPSWIWIAIPVTLNVVAPLLHLVWLYRRGLVSDLDVQRREERARPMAFTLASMLTGVVMLRLIAAPSLVLGISLAQLALVSLVLLITLRWKISMHGAASAAWLTLLLSVAGWSAAPALLILPLVIWSRIHLKRHTPAQVVAGAALGSLMMITMLMIRSYLP